MKLLRLLLLLAVSALVADATVTFERRWRWFQGTSGRGVEVSSDGGYLVSGGTALEGFRYGMVLAMVDSLGDTAWVRHVPDTDMGGGFLCRLGDGGAALLGTDATRHVLVRKYSPAGDSLWNHQSPVKGLISAVVATPDSGCLVVGRLPDSLNHFGVIRLDSGGGQDWARSYREPRVQASWAHDAVITSDGGFLLCGECTDYVDSYVRLLRLDSSGDTVWNRLYTGAVGAGLAAVCQTADNGFLVAGDEFDSLLYVNKLYLMRTDSAGEVVATRSLAPAGAAARARAMARTGDGGYIVAGQVRWTDSTRVWLVRFDENADTLWTRVLGGPANESAYDVELADDLGFVVVGESQAFGGSLLFIKTDSLGRVLSGVAEGPVSGTAFGLRVVPNPAGARGAKLIFNLPVPGTVSIAVIDALGRVIRSGSGQADRSGSLPLECARLGDGVYLVRLTAPGFTSTTRLVVGR